MMNRFHEFISNSGIIKVWFGSVAAFGTATIFYVWRSLVKQAREQSLLSTAWFNGIRKDPPIE